MGTAAAGATRLTWADLPDEIRTRAELIIGGHIVEARSQPSGFSPGTADRVRTSDGRRAFVKAVTPAVNQRSADLARPAGAAPSACCPAGTADG